MRYLYLVYTTQVNSAFRAIWLVPQSRDIKYYSPPLRRIIVNYPCLMGKWVFIWYYTTRYQWRDTTPCDTKRCGTTRRATRRDEIRHHAIRNDMERRDTTRHDTIRRDTTPCDTKRYGTTRRDTTRYDTMRRETIWNDAKRHDKTRYDTMRHDTKRRATIHYDRTRYDYMIRLVTKISESKRLNMGSAHGRCPIREVLKCLCRKISEERTT